MQPDPQFYASAARHLCLMTGEDPSAISEGTNQTNFALAIGHIRLHLACNQAIHHAKMEMQIPADDDIVESRPKIRAMPGMVADALNEIKKGGPVQ